MCPLVENGNLRRPVFPQKKPFFFRFRPSPKADKEDTLQEKTGGLGDISPIPFLIRA